MKASALTKKHDLEAAANRVEIREKDFYRPNEAILDLEEHLGQFFYLVL